MDKFFISNWRSIDLRWKKGRSGHLFKGISLIFNILETAIGDEQRGKILLFETRGNANWGKRLSNLGGDSLLFNLMHELSLVEYWRS
jgi:hypothetical protein